MTDTEPTIPKSRFDDRVRQARETEEALREQIAKLTDANKSLTKQAGKAESLAQQVAKLESDLTAAGQNHGRQMAATRAGITDPEDVADVLAIYNRRAPEGVAFSDWLGSDDLPRSVRSMMPTAEPATTAEPTATEPATATAEPTATPSRLPRPNNGVIPSRSTRGQMSPSDIFAAASDADQYRAMRESMGLPATNPHINRLRRR